MNVAIETVLKGDRHNGLTTLSQEYLGLIYPLLQQILVERQTQRLLKDATEVKLANINQFCQLC